MDFKCDELILGKKDADSRALTEKARLGRLIVRRIPELIPAIKSYPLSEPELLRPCRKLFQSVKAKKRLTEIEALIAALFR